MTRMTPSAALVETLAAFGVAGRIDRGAPGARIETVGEVLDKARDATTTMRRLAKARAHSNAA